MLKVNLCVKEPQAFVNYKLNSFVLEDEQVNFHMDILGEVKSLSKSKKKEYKKIATSFLATLVGFMALSSKSMASTLQQSPSNPMTQTTSLPSGANTGIPPELMEILVISLTVMVAVAVVLCIGMLMAAGLLRAMRKRKEASEWTVDIVKGLTQIILSAPIVFLIYYIAVKVFAGSSWFISPFSIG